MERRGCFRGWERRNKDAHLLEAVVSQERRGVFVQSGARPRFGLPVPRPRRRVFWALPLRMNPGSIGKERGTRVRSTASWHPGRSELSSDGGFEGRLGVSIGGFVMVQRAGRWRKGEEWGKREGERELQKGSIRAA